MAAAVQLLASAPVGAAGFDTEHLFGFMIGTDVGSVGEREFQSQTTGRLGKAAGRYRFGEQEFELEWVPMRDIRIEMGSTMSAHHIGGVPGFSDSRGFTWQGASIDLRYRLVDRNTAPFGMTVAIDGDLRRLDESSGKQIPGYAAGLTLAFDREIVPGRAIAALNLIYRSEWTWPDLRRVERETVVGVSGAVMTDIGAGLLLGAEGRYLRRYDGAGFDASAGQALFVGPTAYVQLTDRTRLTAGWSAQIWGRANRSAAPLDLVNFERHQLRLTYGLSF